MYVFIYGLSVLSTLVAIIIISLATTIDIKGTDSILHLVYWARVDFVYNECQQNLNKSRHIQMFYSNIHPGEAVKQYTVQLKTTAPSSVQMYTL